MEFVTVNAFADEKEVQVIKEIIDALAKELPNLIITPYKTGRLGDRTIITFKVEKSSHKILLKKLTYRNIHTVAPDEPSVKVIEAAKSQIRSAPSIWGNAKLKKKIEEKKTLDEYLQEGNYLEVLKISRDVTLPKELVEKARNSLNDCILHAIEMAYNEARKNKFEIYKSIEKLIKIGSDNNLKVLQKIDYLKKAGLNAVEICYQNREYVGDLINICNNCALHNIVNVKSAVKFGERVLSERDVYRNEIYVAKKNLNTKWLLISYNSVENELHELERLTFNNTIDFIRNNKH